MVARLMGSTLRGNNVTSLNNDLDIKVSELLERLAGIKSHTIESDGNDHLIDCDDFEIAITINEGENSLQIRKIDVRSNQGLGSKLVKMIHSFADEHRLTVTAVMVAESSAGFFRNMGYEEGSEAGEFFRAR
jgi:hypothetical protein